MFREIASRLQQHVGVGLDSTFLYRLSCRNPLLVVQSRVDLRIDQLDAHRIGQLAELGPFDASECMARLERGDRCYAAFAGNELVHYSWAQRSGVHAIEAAGKVLDVAPNELWIYNCRTHHAARGQCIYPAVLRHVLADHFAEGFAIAWIYTSDKNIASQRGIQRVGFTQVATMRAIRLGRYHRPLNDNERSS